MDFGSSHVYAGMPYYSDPANEDTENTNLPQVLQSVYEPVNAIGNSSGQTQNAYDPVYFEKDDSARRDYDLVPYESDESDSGSQSTPPAVTKKHAPPKKSLSTAMLHKAKKAIGKNKKKPNKSESSIPEESKSSTSTKTNAQLQSIQNKPLPPIPGDLDTPPDLPPPRLPPKPTMYKSMDLPPQNDQNITKTADTLSLDKQLAKPMKPEILHPKPLYPALPNHYASNVKNYQNPSKVASAPPASNETVKSSSNYFDCDLICFDEVPTGEYGVALIKYQDCENWESAPQKTPSAPPLTASMIKRDTRSSQQQKNVYAAADTNVVSVNLGIIENCNNSMVWAMPPSRCKKCHAVLLHHALTKDLDVNVCQFCNMTNPDIMEAALPLVGKESDVTYVLSQGASTTSDDPVIIFCVDTSGSMCVNLEAPGSANDHFMSRLQAVQEGIVSQLHRLKQSRPKARVAIITFSDVVTLLGDGSPEQYVTLNDAQLYDTDYIKTTASNILLPGHIANTHEQLLKTVHLLKEHGGTALGPALFLSVALASRKCGSQVIVCTDGRANVGIGSLEIESDYKMCHNFYKETSEFCTESGTVVSILSIEGTDCRLVELGKVADKTAGKIKIANSRNIATEISDILSSKLMATQVEVDIVTQKDLCFQDGEERCRSLVKSFVGNATSDTEITFKYGLQESDDNTPPESAMFQLQVRYLLPNGCMCLRVITQARPVTENRMLAEQGLNPSVVGTYASQLASKLVLDGDLRDAKLTTDSHKKLIRRALSIRSTRSEVGGHYDAADDDRIYGSVCNHMTELDEEINRVADSVMPTPTVTPSTEAPPALPPRRSNSTSEVPRNLSRSSSISSSLSLKLPDVPNTPLATKEKLKEAVDHCPDEVARKLYKHRNACGKMFAAC